MKHSTHILLSGAWGCFDEFNRITVEVLSVIAVQVKCIQDGIKEETPTFDFMGEVKAAECSFLLLLTAR